MTEEEYKVMAKIISNLAYKWKQRMPQSSVLSREDLIQEGWVAFIKNKDRFDPERGVKLTTFLYYIVNSEMNSICTRERTKKRTASFIELDQIPDEREPRGVLRGDRPTCMIDMLEDRSLEGQDRLVMVKDLIAALAEMSVDFANMISDEVPKELLLAARRKIRMRRGRRGLNAVDAEIKIPNAMIEKHFNVSLGNLKRLYYNYL